MRRRNWKTSRTAGAGRPASGNLQSVPQPAIDGLQQIVGGIAGSGAGIAAEYVIQSTAAPANGIVVVRRAPAAATRTGSATQNIAQQVIQTAAWCRTSLLRLRSRGSLPARPTTKNVSQDIFQSAATLAAAGLRLSATPQNVTDYVGKITAALAPT